jgi:hypothetical protein
MFNGMLWLKGQVVFVRCLEWTTYVFCSILHQHLCAHILAQPRDLYQIQTSERPCVCVSVHVFVWAFMCLCERPCACVSVHVFVWASMCLCVIDCRLCLFLWFCNLNLEIVRQWSFFFSFPPFISSIKRRC